jgi:hypothetical protein
MQAMTGDLCISLPGVILSDALLPGETVGTGANII